MSHERRLAVYRHDVEMLATRMAADCDRMLRLVHHVDRAPWRDAIGRALLSARHVIGITQEPGWVPDGDGEAAKRLAGLNTSVSVAMQPVIDAMAVLMRVVPVSVDDELLVADARSVQAMAVAALSLGPLAAAAPGGAEVAPTPIVPDVAGPRRFAAEPQSDGAAAAPNGNAGAHVLVADDSAEIRRTLERMLLRMGHRVTLAANGRDALTIATSQPVDVVLTDIDMPEMDGMDLLRAIKDSSALRHLPVIVISSAADAAHVTQSLEIGADDHVAKPFDATVLQARVRASLLRKRLRDIELDHLSRVGQIAAAAEAVDRNVYVPGSLADVASGRDQIAHTARVFERMVLGMRTREDRLHQRLRRLSKEVGSVTMSAPRTAAQTADAPFASGAIVAGRYEILGLLGRGGMGVVYHAHDRELQEEVAIKVVRADLVETDPALVGRLKQEIRLARRLSHANVVRAHDLGEADGSYFISMELVRGVSLLDMLDQRGRISVDATLAIGVQLADALAVAHSQQIIHRDIKPGNLLMDARGVLKVTDFGLAKIETAEHAHTLRGMVVGTPQYMAPEQLMGGTVDARSDLFAVGVLLYECLTGRTPFNADAPVALLSQMIDADYPRLTSVVADVPRAFATLIGELLQAKPEARPQSAGELSRRLAEIEVPATLAD